MNIHQLVLSVWVFSSFDWWANASNYVTLTTNSLLECRRDGFLHSNAQKIGKPSALWSASLTKLFSYIVCLQLPILFRKPSWIINVRVGDKRLDAFQLIIWISRKVRVQIIGRSCVYFTNFIILLMQFTLPGQNNSSLILFLSFAIKRSREIIFSSVDLVWVFLLFFFLSRSS